VPDLAPSFNPADAIPGFVPGDAMPGVGTGMGPMMGPSPEDLERQKDEQRRAQARAFAQQYAEQRAREAQGTLESVQSMQKGNTSPLNFKIKADPQGVSSLGGALTLPLSERIRLSLGGSYAPARSTTTEIMNQTMPVTSRGQAAANLRFSSPFATAELEYGPSTGLSGMGSVQGRW